MEMTGAATISTNYSDICTGANSDLVSEGHINPRSSVVTVDTRRVSRSSSFPTGRLISPITTYIMGHCPGISEWVDSREPVALARCLRFVESILRTFGALIFVNNVWSGLFFFLACIIHNQYATLVGTLGIVVACSVGLLLNVPTDRLRNGVATFNGFMVAFYVVANAITQPHTSWNPWLIFPALFLSAISTLTAIALHTILQHANLPVLNLPFSLTTLCYLAGQGSTPSPIFPGHLTPIHLYSNESVQHAYGGQEIIQGIFFSISNIYGCDNVPSICLAWLGVLIASPLLCAMCLLGSCTGTGMAMVLGVSTQQLATGMWSFNSLLVSGSIGGFFCVWNAFSCALALMGAAFACVLAGALYHVLGVASLPFQALPLFITDALFLLAVGAYGPRWFVRVNFADITYPEQHRRIYRERLKVQEAAAASQLEKHIHNV